MFYQSNWLSQVLFRAAVAGAGAFSISTAMAQESPRTLPNAESAQQATSVLLDAAPALLMVVDRLVSVNPVEGGWQVTLRKENVCVAANARVAQNITGTVGNGIFRPGTYHADPYFTYDVALLNAGGITTGADCHTELDVRLFVQRSAAFESGDRARHLLGVTLSATNSDGQPTTAVVYVDLSSSAVYEMLPGRIWRSHFGYITLFRHTEGRSDLLQIQ